MCTPGMKFGMSLRHDAKAVVVPAGQTKKIADKRNERARLVVAIHGNLATANQYPFGVGPLIGGALHALSAVTIQLPQVVLDRERLGDVVVEETYATNSSATDITLYVTDIFMTTFGDM